jgi:hypothetical protein
MVTHYDYCSISNVCLDPSQFILFLARDRIVAENNELYDRHTFPFGHYCDF